MNIKTIAVKGLGGRVYLSVAHIEAIVPQTLDPDGGVTAVIRMQSGADYVASFKSLRTRMSFVNAWKQTTLDLSVAPIAPLLTEET